MEFTVVWHQEAMPGREYAEWYRDHLEVTPLLTVTMRTGDSVRSVTVKCEGDVRFLMRTLPPQVVRSPYVLHKWGIVDDATMDKAYEEGLLEYDGSAYFDFYGADDEWLNDGIVHTVTHAFESAVAYVTNAGKWTIE